MPQIQSAVQASNASQVGSNVVLQFNRHGKSSGAVDARDGLADFLIPMVQLRDAQNDEVAWSARVPLGMTSISSIEILCWRIEDAIVRLTCWTAKMAVAAPAALVEDTTDTGADFDLNGDEGGIVPYPVPAASFNALGSVAHGDIVIVNVLRSGGHANDTYANSLGIVGARFTFA